MGDVDISLVLKEMIHATPVWTVLIMMAHFFFRKIQKSYEKIEESVRQIQLSLASANLTKIQSDIENLKEMTMKHDQIFRMRVRT